MASQEKFGHCGAFKEVVMVSISLDLEPFMAFFLKGMLFVGALEIHFLIIFLFGRVLFYNCLVWHSFLLLRILVLSLCRCYCFSKS
jgi:hypothetical protein